MNPEEYTNFYFYLILVTPFFIGLLVELAPFNRRINLKKWDAVLPAAILGILLLVAWIGFTYGDWLYSLLYSLGIFSIFIRIFYMPALPLVSAFMGILLAKTLVEGEVNEVKS